MRLAVGSRIRETLKADDELEPFARLIEALEPWLEQVLVIGGWACRLYLNRLYQVTHRLPEVVCLRALG